MTGEWFGMILLTFFSLVGIFSLVRFLFERAFADDKREEAFFVVPLRNGAENVEYLLRAACYNRRHRVIAVDYGIDEEAREIALRLEAEYSGLVLVKSGDLQEYLAQYAFGEALSSAGA